MVCFPWRNESIWVIKRNWKITINRLFNGMTTSMYIADCLNWLLQLKENFILNSFLFLVSGSYTVRKTMLSHEHIPCP